MQPQEFLRQHPPFDQLSPENLALVEATAELIHVSRGVHLLKQGGPRSEFLFVIFSGAASLVSNGRVTDVLESGDTFGFTSLISGSPPVADVVVTENMVAYRVPETTFRTLLEQSDVKEYFMRGLGARLRALAKPDEMGSAQNLTTPVRLLMTRSPVSVPPDATVQQAAQAMLAENVSSVIVTSLPPGIVTDRDLRGRVLARGLSSATSVSEIMSQPVKSMDSDTPVYGVLLRMMEDNIHHLALMEEGQIVGVITSTDLMRHQLKSPLYLRRQMETVNLESNLGHWGSDITGAVSALHRGGLGATHIGQVVSSLTDTLTTRLLRKAESELGSPPTPYAWIVFGSGGRSEQLLLTDQDNALVYQEASPQAEHYFAALAQRVVGKLIEAGFPPCPGGYMATNWCKTMAEWQQVFEGWIYTPEPQALMEASIFFDFRPVHGDLLLDPLEEIISNAKKQGLFIGHMVRAAQEFAPPLGFFNRIRSDDGMVDIKKGGLAPIVGLARACALAVGSRQRTTLERLQAAAEAGSISHEGAESLADAFQFLLQLRLRQQLASLDAGRTPENRLRLSDLSGREQRSLRDVFVVIREMQQGIGSAFRTEAM